VAATGPSTENSTAGTATTLVRAAQALGRR
jgi:hypothetical protein